MQWLYITHRLIPVTYNNPSPAFEHAGEFAFFNRQINALTTNNLPLQSHCALFAVTDKLLTEKQKTATTTNYKPALDDFSTLFIMPNFYLPL